MKKSIDIISRSYEMLRTLRRHLSSLYPLRFFAYSRQFFEITPDGCTAVVLIDCQLPPQEKRQLITFLYDHPALPFFYVRSAPGSFHLCHPTLHVPYDLPLLSKFFRDTVQDSGEAALQRICGSSSEACLLRKSIEEAAVSELPELFIGQSGTGKSLAAEVLHALSPRRKAPFYVVNVAAISPSLAESELFGTERGAFTDAVSRSGYFSAASGGTLFLDEIGELCPEIQAKLLYVLESGRYRAVGSAGEQKSDVRLVFATNADLEQMMQVRQFREDLYYRISKLVIRLPSLAERRADIPELCHQFLMARNMQITARAVRFLTELPWKGNIRQLFSCLEGAAVRSGKACIDIGHIESSLRR